MPYSEYTNITGTVDGSSVNDSNVITGQIVLTAHDQGPPPGPDFTIPAWCVDLFHTISLGTGHSYLYNEGSLSTDNSLHPSALTADQISKIGDLVAYGDNLMQTSPSDLNSALVQAAIWTVEYNNSAISNTLTVTGGGIDPATIAQTIADAVAYGGQAGQLVSLEGNQGLTYRVPAPTDRRGRPQRPGHRRRIVWRQSGLASQEGSAG